jgi:hypothetical protein
MAINVAKTKFIVFRTRGKVINPLDCQLVYNSNENGLPENQALVYPIERIHNEGDHIASVCTKISKSLLCHTSYYTVLIYILKSPVA